MTTFKGWGKPPRPAPDRALTFDGKRLKIREHGTIEVYALDDVSADGTRAIRLVRLDDDVAGECVVVLSGRASECDCPHGQKWGHRVPCVHVASLLKLQALCLI